MRSCIESESIHSMNVPDLEPLFPDRVTGEPLASQLVRRLRDAIETGALRSGTKMLGSRELAQRLGLGRNTVTLAYEQLSAEGYLEAHTGSGTYVAVPGFDRSKRAASAAIKVPKRTQHIAALRSHFDVAAGHGPLRPGMPALSSFPVSAWTRAARKALGVYESGLGYEPASGIRKLREAIAAHVRQFRGIAALPDQIVVTEGAQSALHLIALVLSKPGDAIAIEDPCYAPARAVFELHGLRPRAVPVDRDGLQTSALPARACVAFVTPTHQFPLGGALPVARRMALLAWANERDAYIIEDDYDSEFTSLAQPLPTLQSLDHHERVVYVGTFSKTLAPGIRAGYAIAPRHLASAFRAARATTSLGVSLQLQATLASFIAAGDFARHIRRMNGTYGKRRSILVDTLSPLLEHGFEIGPTQTGLHASVIAKRRLDDAALATLSDGQRLIALSTLCLKRKDCHGFVLGFTNGSEAEIAGAARRVVTLLQAK
jgi:GntR family transcriptional regulator/MocR family aminotransferase